MSIMSTHPKATPRRTRRGGITAAFLAIAVAAGLSGCSASADESTAQGADAAYGNAEAPAAADVAEAAKASTTDRSVIITGAMYMTVEDPIAAADQAEGLVQKAGGRVDARNETAPDEHFGGAATLTLRIPQDGLDAVVDDLRTLGTVDQFTTDSYDVTVEVTDLDAQISTLRASTARIEGLLADAKNISDIITLENELDGRQAELQSLEAQQRGLNDQVSMSTIDLSLTTEPVVIVIEDDSPATFWDGLVSGWSGLVTFISVALVIIGVLLPWAALLALIVFGVVFTARAAKSRTARRRAASAVTPAAAQPMPAQPMPAQPAQQTAAPSRGPSDTKGQTPPPA